MVLKLMGNMHTRMGLPPPFHTTLRGFRPCAISQRLCTREVLEAPQHGVAVLNGFRGLKRVLQGQQVAGRTRIGARLLLRKSSARSRPPSACSRYCTGYSPVHHEGGEDSSPRRVGFDASMLRMPSNSIDPMRGTSSPVSGVELLPIH